jgi:hypothetical protein
MEKINYKSELEFIAEAFIIAFFSTDYQKHLYDKFKNNFNNTDLRTIESIFDIHNVSLIYLMRNLLKNNIDFINEIVNKSATSFEDKKEILERLKTLNNNCGEIL